MNNNIEKEGSPTEENETETSETLVTPEASEEETKVETENAETEEPKVEEETLTLTQSELDKAIGRSKAVAERKAARKLEAKYQAELEKIKSNMGIDTQTTSPQVQNSNQPPSPNHVWDENLGWIANNISREEYSRLVSQALTGSNPQPYSAPTPMPQASPGVNVATPQTDDKLSENALDQIDECMIDVDGFKDDMVSAVKSGLLTGPMLNAAALSPDGIKSLYEQVKSNPLEISKISQLSPVEQQSRIWQFNADRVKKSQPKVETKVMPQPEPIEVNGTIVNSEADQSYLQKKRAATREIWGD